MSLAGLHRRLGRTDEEMAALDRVLFLQPRNPVALLQIASLHKARGDTRTAAAACRTALEGIPAGTDLGPDLRRMVQDARATIDANNRNLETFLETRFQDLRARHGDAPLGRFDRALDTFLLKRRVYRPQPGFLYFPHLPAIEFYERADFPWLTAIEAATDTIRTELFDVLADDAPDLRPYMAVQGPVAEKWGHLNNSRRWGAYFLWREGVPVPAHIARCPKTVAALDDWPRCDLPGFAPTAMFSILEPRTRIPPHTGVNNCRLVAHIPLVIPPGCGFRVGAETRGWELGHAFVFDDTIEHEAWNESDDWRAVLIIDIWNPCLTQAEREMVSALTMAVDEFYGDLPGYIRPVQSEA
jgi:aspartyl/asparaginyl beta-hydroxylase (cupin superfamily)